MLCVSFSVIPVLSDTHFLGDKQKRKKKTQKLYAPGIMPSCAHSSLLSSLAQLLLESEIVCVDSFRHQLRKKRRDLDISLEGLKVEKLKRLGAKLSQLLASGLYIEADTTVIANAF